MNTNRPPSGQSMVRPFPALGRGTDERAERPQTGGGQSLPTAQRTATAHQPSDETSEALGAAIQTTLNLGKPQMEEIDERTTPVQELDSDHINRLRDQVRGALIQIRTDPAEGQDREPRPGSEERLAERTHSIGTIAPSGSSSEHIDIHSLRRLSDEEIDQIVDEYFEYGILIDLGIIDGIDESAGAIAPVHPVVGPALAGSVALLALPFTAKAVVDIYAEAQASRQGHREHKEDIQNAETRGELVYPSERAVLRGERAEARFGHFGTAGMVGMTAGVAALAPGQFASIADATPVADLLTEIGLTTLTPAQGATIFYGLGKLQKGLAENEALKEVRKEVELPPDFQILDENRNDVFEAKDIFDHNLERLKTYNAANKTGYGAATAVGQALMFSGVFVPVTGFVGAPVTIGSAVSRLIGDGKEAHYRGKSDAHPAVPDRTKVVKSLSEAATDVLASRDKVREAKLRSISNKLVAKAKLRQDVRDLGVTPDKFDAYQSRVPTRRTGVLPSVLRSSGYTDAVRQRVDEMNQPGKTRVDILAKNAVDSLRALSDDGTDLETPEGIANAAAEVLVQSKSLEKHAARLGKASDGVDRSQLRAQIAFRVLNADGDIVRYVKQLVTERLDRQSDGSTQSHRSEDWVAALDKLVAELKADPQVNHFDLRTTETVQKSIDAHTNRVFEKDSMPPALRELEGIFAEAEEELHSHRRSALSFVGRASDEAAYQRATTNQEVRDRYEAVMQRAREETRERANRGLPGFARCLQRSIFPSRIGSDRVERQIRLKQERAAYRIAQQVLKVEHLKHDVRDSITKSLLTEGSICADRTWDILSQLTTGKSKKTAKAELQETLRDFGFSVRSFKSRMTHME